MQCGDSIGEAAIAEIHPARLGCLFETDILGRVIVLLDRTRSTNSAASEAAAAGAMEGTIVLADVQTGGRGRAGRVWHSSRGNSLVFSLILRPRRIAAGLTMLLALGAVRALERFQDGISIKWPNDIYCRGLKLAGILAESKAGVVVLGAGININEGIVDFDVEIKSIATSLRLLTGTRIDRGVVLGAIVGEFESDYLRWNEEGLSPFIGAIGERLLYSGEDIWLDAGSGIVEGRLTGITEEGHLRVQTGDGEKIFVSGDIRAGGR